MLAETLYVCMRARVYVCEPRSRYARNYLCGAQSPNATEDARFIIWVLADEDIVDIIYTPPANGTTIISS